MVRTAKNVVSSDLPPTTQRHCLHREQHLRPCKLSFLADRLSLTPDFKETLDYSCVCSSGQSPNSTEYSQTIPYFVCTAYNTQCQANCNGDSTCQAACVQDHPCGAQEPRRYNTTSSATGATATATGTATTSGGGDVLYTGFGTGSASVATGGTSAGSVGVMRPFLSEFGQVYGLFMVAAGLAGGFAVVL